MNEALVSQLNSARLKLGEALGESWCERLPKNIAASIDGILIGSDFVVDQLIRDGGLVEWLNNNYGLILDEESLQRWVNDALCDSVDINVAMSRLRVLRNRIMVGLICQDFSGQSDLWAIVRALSSISGCRIL